MRRHQRSRFTQGPCIHAIAGVTAGFTLMELAIVAAVLVMASAVSFPGLVRFYEAQKLRQAAIELQSHLLRGRALATRLQQTCTVSIGSGASATTVQVTGSNACASTNLAALNLSQLIGVRGLCVSSSGSNCSAPTPISFLPLGVLVGQSSTLYITSTVTPAQACLDLSLTLVRVGFRPTSTSTCTYSRS